MLLTTQKLLPLSGSKARLVMKKMLTFHLLKLTAMKKLLPLLLLMGLCYSNFAFSDSEMGKGSLKVKVEDNQHLKLPGASIQLVSTYVGSYTDNNGEALLANIPAGDYQIKITYIGYESQEKSIRISPGKATEILFQLQAGVNLTKGVIVLGDRLKGQAKALNGQKNNIRITNIISADQVGRFPDANIGDALKRVPGITMQNDQGEARDIFIRGLSPELNSVTLNGNRIPSAEGDNRRVQMDLIPSDMIQIIDVNKTLTPDMDGDAIGGSVNLVTHTAPTGLRISGTLSGGFNPVRDKPLYTGSFLVGRRFVNNKLGFIMNGSYNNDKYGSDNIEPAWKLDDNDNAYVSKVNTRRYEEWRIRRSIGASLDYKINPNNVIYLDGMYNWRDDRENRFQYEITKIKQVTDDEGNVTGYTGNLIKQDKGGIDNDRNKSRRLEDQRMRTANLRGDHLIADKFKLDWNVAYSKASEKKPHERYIGYEVDKIPLNIDLSNPRFPFASPAEAVSAGDYKLDELSDQHESTYETELASQANFQLPASLIAQQQGFLKFGLKMRHKKKDRDNNFFSYSPIDENDAMNTLAGATTANKDVSGFYPGDKYKLGLFPTAKYMGGLELDNPALFKKTDEPAEYLADNYHAKENISAAYLMLNQDITNKLSAAAGLRFEYTKTNYTGNIIENEDELEGDQTRKNDYTNFLPDVILKYKVSNNFLLRTAWTNSLARPDYYALVPYVSILSSDQQVDVGNPDLKATTASNFDFMAENYFKSVGIVSAGFFYKKLKDFIYKYRDETYTTSEFSSDFPSMSNPIPGNEEWVFTQPKNGDEVKIFGFELALQRQLDFLPGFLKDLGIYLNYTYTHSKADGIYNEDGEKREGLKLPGTAPNLFNGSLSYENKWVTVRLSANYAGSYLDEVGGTSFDDSYYDHQFFLDANASVVLMPKFRIFAEANNLTNQPLRYYQGISERTLQAEYYGPRFNLGVKFDLSK